MSRITELEIQEIPRNLKEVYNQREEDTKNAFRRIKALASE
jgi:hypothetical protein